MNLTGIWKGEYTFEEGRDGGGAQVAGHVVNFTIEMKQGWLGTVSGTVQDDARNGFPEAGTIRGRLKGNVLTFRRHMPVMRLMHERNRMTVEQLAERHKIVLDTVPPHPSVLHAGDLSEDGKTIEGRWKMNGTSVEIPGSYQIIQLPTLEGTFKITRA